MSDDELESLTDKIGGGNDEGLEKRLDDTDVEDVGGDDREPDELIKALGGEDPEESAEAADEIERLVEEEPEALKEYEEDLIDALEIDDNWAKRAAASALAEVGSEDAAEPLEELDMPEADEAVEEIRERHGIEEEVEEEIEEEEEEAATPSTTDGGMESGTAGGTALDAAKNGNGEVDFTEIVLLQMLESDKDEPSKFAEQSLRHAIREYPEVALDQTEEFAERLIEGREDLRRYASLVMHEVSEEYVDEAREHVDELLESLGDDDDEVSHRGEEALTNVAEEYPTEVVGGMSEKSKN